MILNKSWGKQRNTVGVVSRSIFFLRTLNMDMLSCHLNVKSTIEEKVKANLKPRRSLTQRINYYLS